MESPKQKGDITQASLVKALLIKGFPVLIPVGDNQRYDLVIQEGEQFKRIQCKTARLKNGKLIFNTASTSPYYKGRKSYLGEIDYFGVYCLELDKNYLIPIEHISTKAEGCLRLDPPKQNRSLSKIRFAKDYEI